MYAAGKIEWVVDKQKLRPEREKFFGQSSVYGCHFVHLNSFCDFKNSFWALEVGQSALAIAVILH